MRRRRDILLPQPVSLHVSFDLGPALSSGLREALSTCVGYQEKATAPVGVHSPHWSVCTRSQAWLLYQQLHQHGGRSSRQGHHKMTDFGLLSHISAATS